jgi:diadenylate cyclase
VAALIDQFLNLLSEFWAKLYFLFSNIKFADVLDVAIVAFLIYEVILLVRHTRAQQLAYGVLLLLLVWVLSRAANLRALQVILEGIMSFGLVAVVVIFQPELRRALEQVGGVNTALSKLFRQKGMDDSRRSQWEGALVAVCDAAERMGEEKVGALIVLERQTNLVEIIHTGTPLHSDVNVEVLTTVFYEGTPLHDGAVVIREGRVEAAGCFLPLSNNLEIGKDMGTRHRAALGMSENSDAVVVVVSEETGIISLAKTGVMIRRLDRQNLFNLLISEMIPPQAEDQKNGLFRRILRGVKRDKQDE